MILIEGCTGVALMDDAQTEIEGGSILIDGGVIRWVGRGQPPTTEAVERVEGNGLVRLGRAGRRLGAARR